MQKFWMVIKSQGVGAERTSCRHPSLETARQEAYRLTRAHGGDFIILEAIEGMKEPEPAYMQSSVSLDELARRHAEGVVTDDYDDGIPF